MTEQKTNQAEFSKGFEEGYAIGNKFEIANNHIEVMRISLENLLHQNPFEMDIQRAGNYLERGKIIIDELSKVQLKYQFADCLNPRLSNLLTKFNEIHSDLCEEYEYLSRAGWGNQNK